MPIYKIKTPDGRIMKIKGDYPPPQDIVEEAYSKLPPLEAQKPQVQETQIQESVKEPVQEENLLQKLLRLDREAVEKKEKELQERGITGIFGKPAKIQTVPEIAKQALSLGSFGKIIKGAEKLPKIARIAGEILPQAVLGAGATYLGEREKGAYKDEALKAAGKGALLETAVGAGIEAVGASTKGLGKIITKNIPDDLYQKAKKFSEDTAVSVEKRIEQITNLGKKALKNNEIIAKKADKKALDASTENKNSAKTIANKMAELAKDFFEKQKLDSRAKMISKIPDLKLENAINQEHQRLIRNAQTITEDGRVLPRKEEKAVLKDFEDLFILKPKPTVLLDQFGKPITVSKGKAPIQNKKIFLDNLDKLQDKTAYGAGKDELKQQFSSIYSNLNNFLKENSKEYNDLKELGQSIVKFSKKETKFDPQLYDSNKILDDLTKSIETFKKLPDKDSLKIINDVVDQANKILGTKYKTKDIIKKFDQNEQLKLLKNEGNLSDSQLNLLDKKSKRIYQDNRDLGKVTKKGFFKPEQDVKQFVEGQEGTGLTGSRLAELLDPKLVEQIEIEQAGRFFKQPLKIDIPVGTIATPTVRALQAARGAIKLPRTQFQIKKLLEGDSVTTKRLGLGARTLGRAAAREAVRSDEQKQDVVLDERNQPIFIKRESFPNKIKRNKSGKITNQEQIENERGVVK